MEDEGEETPEGAEGEEDLSAEVVVLDDTLKLRYCYSIALLAGEGVKIEDLQVFVFSYCRNICASKCPPSFHSIFFPPLSCLWLLLVKRTPTSRHISVQRSVESLIANHCGILQHKCKRCLFQFCVTMFCLLCKIGQSFWLSITEYLSNVYALLGPYQVVLPLFRLWGPSVSLALTYRLLSLLVP